MTTIKATPSMIAAVRAVRPLERLAAMKLAETTFRAALARYRSFGDFSEAQDIAMAGDTAAAEVAFRFA